MAHALWVVGALVIAGVLVWLKMWPKVVAVLAFVVGLNASGWARGWLTQAIQWVSGWGGWLLSKLLGLSKTDVAAAVPAVIGAVLFIVVLRHMWPKKGHASLLTAAAAFALPMLWPALVAGLEVLSPGITRGGA
jgi:uncharacterized membrane protein YeaQ/YmgE (transglycosylase-associated protein family)